MIYLRENLVLLLRKGKIFLKEYFKIFSNTFLHIFRINAVMDHVQTLYLIPSLKAKLHLKILSIQHIPGSEYEAGTDALE